MPPNRSQSARYLTEQEGRISLAISAINKKEISSVRQAAHCYNVPRSTLQDRLRGHTYRGETRANNHKLSNNEEEALL